LVRFAARVADEGLPIRAAPLIQAGKFLRLDRRRIDATSRRWTRPHSTLQPSNGLQSDTNSMGCFERMELRQVASFMGLESGARGVAGELHLQGGEHGLRAGGCADLDRHPDEVEPAG
jgi:hypothetical protein